MARPVKELAGFARVSLAPGEAARVAFRVHPSQTAFLDKEMRWKTEAGDIDALLGSSSEDIRLCGSFRITESQWIDGARRAFAADVRITPVKEEKQ